MQFFNFDDVTTYNGNILFSKEESNIFIKIEVSTIVSGLIPADINLIGHSILVWIGMLTVFPGLFIFAKLNSNNNPYLTCFSFPLTCRLTTKTFLLGSFRLGNCINLQIDTIKFLYKNAHLSGTYVK